MPRTLPVVTARIAAHSTALEGRVPRNDSFGTTRRAGIPHVSRSGRFDIRNLDDSNEVVIVVKIANMRRKQTVEAVMNLSSRGARLCPL